ncbi:MAG: hypothetical protein VB876_19720 [Pirellulales bacterium]
MSSAIYQRPERFGDYLPAVGVVELPWFRKFTAGRRRLTTNVPLATTVIDELVDAWTLRIKNVSVNPR